MRKPAEQLPASTAPARYLSRSEAAELLGVAVSTMMQYEQRGKIVPHWAVIADSTGRLRNSPIYHISDVLKLPRKAPNPTPDNPDELTARAFELFEQGKSLREVIILLRATKEKIDRLHEDWLDVGGAVFTLSEDVRKALEAELGPLASPEHLLERVRACKKA